MKATEGKIFTLRTKDYLKGLILAVITAAITFLITALQSSAPVNLELLKQVGVASIIAFLSYILKNFATNSKDEFLTSEK